MTILISIIVWIIFLVVCINVGKEKNRNGFLWGFFFGPFGLLILAILPKIEPPSQVQTSSYSSVSQNRKQETSNLPVFMRRQLEESSVGQNSRVSSKDVVNLPRVIAKEEEKNTYFENNINSKKWICGKCSSINTMKVDQCTKCGNNKGILKMNY